MFKNKTLSLLWGSFSFFALRMVIVMLVVMPALRFISGREHLSTLIALAVAVIAGMLSVYAQGAFPFFSDLLVSTKSHRKSVYYTSIARNLVFIVGFFVGVLLLAYAGYVIGDIGVQYLHTTYALLVPVFGGVSVFAYAHALARLDFLGVKYSPRVHTEENSRLAFFRTNLFARTFRDGVYAPLAPGAGRPFAVLFFAWALLMHSVFAVTVFAAVFAFGFMIELLVQSVSARVNRLDDAHGLILRRAASFSRALVWLVVPTAAWSAMHGYVRGYMPENATYVYATLLIAPLVLSLVHAYKRLGASESELAVEALRLRGLLVLALSLGVIAIICF